MTSPRLTIGFSPCPNDTFIFDAIVNRKIDTEGIDFEPVIEDVETLNQKAIRGELDVTKISFAACLHALDQYQVLNAGSALGKGVGPLLVSKDDVDLFLRNEGRDITVAIPGKNTTANFLFGIFFPETKNKVEMVFSEIEDAVLSGKVGAGVLIHENRFTYEQRGLKKICDLGDLWEKETGLPIPLGGIAVKRNLPEEVKQKVDRLVRKSVEYAFANPHSSDEYVKMHAQEMDEEVRRKHIALYVNSYSVNLGVSGRHAIEVLFQKARETGLVGEIEKNIFVGDVPEKSIYRKVH